MRVRFTPRARGDLDAIVEYLATRDPRAAQGLKRAFDSTVRLIQQFPHSGRRAGERDARVLPVGRYPYLIYWIVQGDEARVLHLRDGRRKPWAPIDS